MTSNEERTVAKALRIALGYGSREERIAELKASREMDVRYLIGSLERAGLVMPSSVKEIIDWRLKPR